MCISHGSTAAQLGSPSGTFPTAWQPQRHIPHSLAAPGELSRQRLARTRYELPLVGVQHHCVHRCPALILPLAAGGTQVPNLDCATTGTQGDGCLAVNQKMASTLHRPPWPPMPRSPPTCAIFAACVHPLSILLEPH